MLALSLSTAVAMALHATKASWVMFVQCTLVDGRPGPIKIEGVRGDKLGARLIAVAKGYPFEVQLVGLLMSAMPKEDAEQIYANFANYNLHDDWYDPSNLITSWIEDNAQSPIHSLLAATHPAALEGDNGDTPVTIDEIAEILGVAVVTVRRMIRDKRIPAMRWGHVYRFVPRDVIAALSR